MTVFARSPQTDGPPFAGWRIVRGGFAIQALHSGLVFNAFALIAVELRNEFGWSASALGAAFALNRAESGLLGPIQGWMTDKWGPRVVLRIGAVIMAIGLVAFATIDSLIEFYLFYLLVSLGSSLAGFLGITVAIVNWFERKRARALALAQMGFAVGGAFAFLVGLALHQFGWRTTSVLSAGLTLVVILPLSRHFEQRPEDVGQFVDGIDPDTVDAEATPLASTVSLVHFTAREAMRTRAFWFISIGHASALLVVGASMAHLGLYLEEERGLSTLHTALVVGMLPAMMGVGQLLGGVLGDRFDKRIMITIAMLGHGLGMLLLALATNWLLIWLFVLFHGLAWGIRGPIQSAMRADYFGATSFGKIMGFSSMIVMLGMVVGPVVAGVLRDQTGNYRLGFIILAAIAALGSVWFFLSTPPAPPERGSPADEQDPVDEGPVDEGPVDEGPADEAQRRPRISTPGRAPVNSPSSRTTSPDTTVAR